MPRIPRLDTPGSRHHVMNRGARRERVFPDDESRRVFLDLVGELPARGGTLVHGYALMPNHFHLVLTAGRDGLGPALKHVQWRYGRYLNQRFRWDGPLWRARFKSRLVDSEDYWRHLLAYVHLNPARAGLSEQLLDPLWTSHTAYVAEPRRPTWLDVGTHLPVFGSVQQYVEYLAELVQGQDVAPAGFDPDRLWRAAARTQPPAIDHAPPPEQSPIAWPMSEEAALSAFEFVTGRNAAFVMAEGPGRPGRPNWWLAMWWLPRARGITNAEFAREIGRHPAAVSRAQKRAVQHAELDDLMAHRMGRLGGLLP